MDIALACVGAAAIAGGLAWHLLDAPGPVPVALFWPGGGGLGLAGRF